MGKKLKVKYSLKTHDGTSSVQGRSRTELKHLMQPIKTTTRYWAAYQKNYQKSSCQFKTHTYTIKKGWEVPCQMSLGPPHPRHQSQLQCSSHACQSDSQQSHLCIGVQECITIATYFNQKCHR